MIEDVAERAFEPARRVVAAGRIPGAALGMVTADGRRSVRIAGMAALVPKPEPLTEEHWFDLASLTKVIATRDDPRARRTRRIELDRPSPMRSRTSCNTTSRRGRAEVTFRDCLAHRTSCRRSSRSTLCDDPARLRAFVLQRVWRARSAVYSDINFIFSGHRHRADHGGAFRWPLGRASLGPPPGLPSRPKPAPGAAG
jgi:hypothetical protein